MEDKKKYTVKKDGRYWRIYSIGQIFFFNIDKATYARSVLRWRTKKAAINAIESSRKVVVRPIEGRLTCEMFYV